MKKLKSLTTRKPYSNINKYILIIQTILYLYHHTKLYIKTYSSIKQCANDLKISPKTIAKYLNTGLIYNGLIKKNTN